MKLKFTFPLLVLLFAVQSFAQVSDTYVIPAAIDGAGLNNSRWATDFHLFNPQATTLRVTLSYLPTGGAVGSTVKFNVPPNSTAYAENILEDVFDLSGGGSLLVATFAADNPTIPDRMIDRAFVVTTRTYNTSAVGTFGQSIPGGFYGLQDVESDGITGIASGIQNTSTGPTGYRTNVGAVNLGRYSLKLYVNVYDEEGDTVGQQLAFDLPPQAHFQQRLPIAVEHGSIEFFVDDPSEEGVVFPYASVIDNRTNDPVYVAPVLLATPARLAQKTAKAVDATPRRITNSEAKRLVSTTGLAASASRDASGKLMRTAAVE
jgi:hypothetical protein